MKSTTLRTLANLLVTRTFHLTSNATMSIWIRVFPFQKTRHCLLCLNKKPLTRQSNKLCQCARLDLFYEQLLIKTLKQADFSSFHLKYFIALHLLYCALPHYFTTSSYQCISIFCTRFYQNQFPQSPSNTQRHLNWSATGIFSLSSEHNLALTCYPTSEYSSLGFRLKFFWVSCNDSAVWQAGAGIKSCSIGSPAAKK